MMWDVRRLIAVTAAVGALVAVAPAPAALQAEPSFQGTVSRIGPGLRERMTGVSWHRGCPVPLRKLRLLQVSFWGYDGQVHAGRLIVKGYQAPKIRLVLKQLFDARFPIRRMRLIDAYGGSDRRSLRANNTSAFNCRFVAGTTRWSQHAYGRAIDINPVQNPYVSNGVASPPSGQRYVDRTKRAKGMIRPGGVVVRAFASVGWEWGGFWTSPKDYQHFSSTGS
jgi:poly-gamma-glutamate synthesis protein (capsule biosynthesis protein)